MIYEATDTPHVARLLPTLYNILLQNYFTIFIIKGDWELFAAIGQHDWRSLPHDIFSLKSIEMLAVLKMVLQIRGNFLSHIKLAIMHRWYSSNNIITFKNILTVRLLPSLTSIENVNTLGQALPRSGRTHESRRIAVWKKKSNFKVQTLCYPSKSFSTTTFSTCAFQKSFFF